MSYGRDDTGHLGMSDEALRHEVIAQRKYLCALVCLRRKDKVGALEYLKEARDFTTVMYNHMDVFIRNLRDAELSAIPEIVKDYAVSQTAWDELIAEQRG